MQTSQPTIWKWGGEEGGGGDRGHMTIRKKKMNSKSTKKQKIHKTTKTTATKKNSCGDAFCNEVTSWLIHFMSLVSFDTTWKYQKTRGFLNFSGGIERDQWHEMGSGKKNSYSNAFPETLNAFTCLMISTAQKKKKKIVKTL